MSVAYFLSVRDTQMIDVSQRLSFLWWQFGCFICFSLTISLAIDRTSRFYLCSPVTPCLFRWQKNRRWSSDSCRVNFVWSKERETSVHERDEEVPSNDWLVRRGELLVCSCLWSSCHFSFLLINQPLFRMPFWWLAQEITRIQFVPTQRNPPCETVRVIAISDWGLFCDFILWSCQLLISCPFVTPRWLMCLNGSLSCADSSDALLASASQSVLLSIALQDFICAHLWPHAFWGDKRTDPDQATVVEWILYDQRNEKRGCMNATSMQHICAPCYMSHSMHWLSYSWSWIGCATRTNQKVYLGGAFGSAKTSRLTDSWFWHRSCTQSRLVATVYSDIGLASASRFLLSRSARSCPRALLIYFVFPSLCARSFRTEVLLGRF